MSKELNIRIANLIEGLPGNYTATPEEILFFKRYTGCDDFLLSDTLIENIWKWFKEELLNYGPEGDKDIPGAVSILHTNSGAGKVLEKAPSNSVITAYNLDYTCKRITDFVCQKRKDKGLYFSAERDISQYFALCNTNSSRKYSIVITQPKMDMEFYRGIDYNKEIGNKNPLYYYSERGAHFLDESGYLVVIFEPKYIDEINRLSQTLGMEIVKMVEDKDLKYEAYEAVILRKK